MRLNSSNGSGGTQVKMPPRPSRTVSRLQLGVRTSIFTPTPILENHGGTVRCRPRTRARAEREPGGGGWGVTGVVGTRRGERVESEYAGDVAGGRTRPAAPDRTAAGAGFHLK
ncbi:hypothetical protein JCM9533A_68400 [Catenuloplanes niger JCM 9533]